MRLRKPCEHGRYDRHLGEGIWAWQTCPGGEFLLVDELAEVLFNVPFHGEMSRDFVRRQAVKVLDGAWWASRREAT